MPANAGIQVRFRFNFRNGLDSGFHRNDGNKSRLLVDKSRTLDFELLVANSSVMKNCKTASRC
jgi:hypothetical protein